MAVSYVSIGRHIAQARKRCGLTQQELAEKLDLSLSYYGKLERGAVGINLTRLGEICEALRTPIEELVAGCLITNVQLQALESNDVGARFSELLKGCSPDTVELVFRVAREIVMSTK